MSSTAKKTDEPSEAATKAPTAPSPPTTTADGSSAPEKENEKGKDGPSKEALLNYIKAQKIKLKKMQTELDEAKKKQSAQPQQPTTQTLGGGDARAEKLANFGLENAIKAIAKFASLHGMVRQIELNCIILY
jgi:hypothetical protein